jgi:hypothetical protein
MKPFAVFGVDPGGVSGWASGMFRPAHVNDEMGDLVGRAVERGVLVGGECRGSYADQTWELFEKWLGFRHDWVTEYGQDADRCYLVVEDFALRKRNVDLTPCYVTGGLVTLARHYEPIMQMPSEGKTYATDDRLREWGAWLVGSRHARDAVRHVLTRASIVYGLGYFEG